MYFVCTFGKEGVTIMGERGVFNNQQSMETAKQELTPIPRYEVRPYTPEEAPLIHRELELPNWAPWLAASVETLAKRAEVFPRGQIALWTPDGMPVAAINLSRFNYNGNPADLPTWDQLMGDPPTSETTYNPNGNSVGMMSINVSPKYQGRGVTEQVVEAVRNMTKEEDIENVMGSFRPSQYGKFALDNPEVSLEEYTRQRVPWKNGETTRRDQWIGILENKFGMKEIRWDEAAMVVPDVPTEQVEEWRKTYKPEMWRQVTPGIWLCGETGLWVVKNGTSTYIEGNVWGILEKKAAK